MAGFKTVDVDWEALGFLDDAPGIQSAGPPVEEDEVEMAMRVAGEIFREADVDGSGGLDAEELAGIITNLLARMGKELPQDFRGPELPNKVRKSLVRFDGDGNGTIDFDEFLQMLCCAPWRAMLPKGIRERMPHLVVLALGGKEIPAMPNTKRPKSSGAQDAMATVRRIFDQADLNESGDIDPEQLGKVVQYMFHYFKKPMPRDFSVNMEEVVRKTMARYDKNNSGTLSFDEFVAMLCQPPWHGLLPVAMREELPNLLAQAEAEQAALEAPEQPAPASEEPAGSSQDAQVEEEVFKTEDAVEQAARRSEAAVAKMRRMFERADKNNSGEIDSEELAPLMQMMYKDWGKPIPHDFKVHLKDTVQLTMVRFDVDKSGTISFDEFLQMLCCPPWRGLMPKEMRKSLSSAAAPPPPAPPPKKPPRVNSANDALAMIEELFRAGDNDGSGDIDPVELSKLVVQIFEKLRKPIPHDFRCDLEGVIRKAMQRFDVDNSGTINFTEFLELLSCPPWRGLLPSKIRKELPKLVLGGKKVRDVPRTKGQKAVKDARTMPVGSLLDALGIVGCTQAFVREGFGLIGDLLEVAYKLNEKDLESLGVAAAIHQKRLLKMIRSGDPVAFIERYEQAQKMQAEMALHFDTGGKRISEANNNAKTATRRRSTPTYKRHADLKLPGPPSPNRVISPCTPVRIPGESYGPRQERPNTGWTLGMAPERPSNSTWEDRSPNHRVKSRLSVMDRPVYPRSIINHSDMMIYRGYIAFENKGVQDTGFMLG